MDFRLVYAPEQLLFKFFDLFPRLRVHRLNRISTPLPFLNLPIRMDKTLIQKRFQPFLSHYHHHLQCIQYRLHFPIRPIHDLSLLRKENYPLLLLLFLRSHLIELIFLCLFFHHLFHNFCFSYVLADTKYLFGNGASFLHFLVGDVKRGGSNFVDVETIFEEFFNLFGRVGFTLLLETYEFGPCSGSFFCEFF